MMSAFGPSGYSNAFGWKAAIGRPLYELVRCAVPSLPGGEWEDAQFNPTCRGL